MLNNRAHVSYPGDLNSRFRTSTSSSHTATLSNAHRNNGVQGQDEYEDEGGDERFQHSDHSQHIGVHLTSNQWNGACMPVLTHCTYSHLA
jgi:uncharacterized protein YdeI (BOF family)